MVENIKFNSNINVNNVFKVIDGDEIYRLRFIFPEGSVWDGCSFDFDFECYMDIPNYGKINLRQLSSSLGTIYIRTGNIIEEEGEPPQEEAISFPWEEGIENAFDYIYTSDIAKALAWRGWQEYVPEGIGLVIDEPEDTTHPSIQVGHTVYSPANLMVRTNGNNLYLGNGNDNDNDSGSIKIGNAPCAAYNSLLVGNGILGPYLYDDSGNRIPSDTIMKNSIIGGVAPEIPDGVQTGLFFGDGSIGYDYTSSSNLFAAYTQDYQRKYQFGNVIFTEQQLQFLNTLNAAKFGPQEIMTISYSYDSPSWAECMDDSGNKTSGWYTEITQNDFNKLKVAEKVKLVPSEVHPAFNNEGTVYRKTCSVDVFEAISNYVGYHPFIRDYGADFTIFAGKISGEEKQYAIVVSDAIWEKFGAPVYNGSPGGMMDLTFYK